MQEYDLKTDPEFDLLHIKASEGFEKSLEQSILYSGVGHPLIVWQGILVDGYKRYRICKREHLPFRIRSIELGSRLEAMVWICDRMMLRQDLSEERRKYYIGKKFLLMSEIIQGRFSEGPAGDDRIPLHPVGRYKLADMIGLKFNLSGSAVMKYGLYASALESIRKQDSFIFDRIISGEVRISHENTLDISNLRGDDMRILRECFSDSKRKHISHSEIWHELQWNRVHTTPPSGRKKKVDTAGIKQMPEYDPDAEISSLALTIPSWIKSIERTVNNADFKSATVPAKDKLKEQLRALWRAAEFLYSFIQEASNECN